MVPPTLEWKVIDENTPRPATPLTKVWLLGWGPQCGFVVMNWHDNRFGGSAPHWQMYGPRVPEFKRWFKAVKPNGVGADKVYVAVIQPTHWAFAFENEQELLLKMAASLNAVQDAAGG